jgi:hypothetical protein
LNLDHFATLTRREQFRCDDCVGGKQDAIGEEKEEQSASRHILRLAWPQRLEIARVPGCGKPHRRFLILKDDSVVTCDLSLNNRLPPANEVANYDRNFVSGCWASAKPL